MFNKAEKDSINADQEDYTYFIFCKKYSHRTRDTILHIRQVSFTLSTAIINMAIQVQHRLLVVIRLGVRQNN